jgi:hypothetical protein
MAQTDHLHHPTGRHGNAIFIVFYLFGYADNHPCSSKMSDGSILLVYGVIMCSLGQKHPHA